ncbi:hypothetical protein [Nostoc sp.]
MSDYTAPLKNRHHLTDTGLAYAQAATTAMTYQINYYRYSVSRQNLLYN